MKKEIGDDDDDDAPIFLFFQTTHFLPLHRVAFRSVCCYFFPFKKAGNSMPFFKDFFM